MTDSINGIVTIQNIGVRIQKLKYRSQNSRDKRKNTEF